MSCCSVWNSKGTKCVLEYDTVQCIAIKVQVYFGIYICIALFVIIIAISLLGRIKEAYRWFILNQAVFVLIYLIALQVFGMNFDAVDGDYFEFKNILLRFLGYLFIMTFFTNLLLSVYRLLCLYNPHVDIDKKLNVGITIVIYDLLVVFYMEAKDYCQGRELQATTDLTEPMYIIQRYDIIDTSVIAVVAMISSACAFAIMVKVSFQIRRQIQMEQRNMLKNSLKIALILLVQSFILDIISTIRLLHALNEKFSFLPDFYNDNYEFQFLCVMIDCYFSSIMTLFLLNNYRNVLFKSVKFLFSRIRGFFSQKIQPTSGKSTMLFVNPFSK